MWQPNAKNIAIFASDLHLSHKAPLFRSNEDCWYSYQHRIMNEVSYWSRLHSPGRDPLPIFIAGDIFHRWNSPPELINLALRSMPKVYAIPGQHDLPMHSYEDRHKSAYWTLQEAGKINNLLPPRHEESPKMEGFEFGDMEVHPFPWGFDIEPPLRPHDLLMQVALVHRYVWIKDHGYAQATFKDRLKFLKSYLRDYDVVVFGDNHSAFEYQLKDGPLVINCGTMMRRNANERDYKPSVVLFRSDKTYERLYFDLSHDKIMEIDTAQMGEVDMGTYEFITTMHSLAESTIEFGETLRRFLEGEDLPGTIKDAVIRALEKGREG